MPLLPLVRPTYTPTDGMQQPRSTLREPGLGLYLLVMNNRDKLDKVREWLQTAGLVAIPFAVAIMGNKVSESNATRETSAQYVGKAMDILAHDTAHADRVWAVRVLARYSEVPFSAGAESMLVRVAPGLFAEVVGRQVSRLLVCDFAGHNCRPMVIERLPSMPVQIVLSRVTITILRGDSARLTAIGLTAYGDTASISDLTWTASGGSISDTSTNGGRHYALFKAGTATGDFVVVARSPSARLADSARVHVQAR